MDSENDDKKDSKVGKILAESTQKATFLLIYAMILAAAVLDPQHYLEVPPGFGFGLKVLN